MKIIDTLLFALAIVAFTIGVHQSFYYGIENSYWLFMISLLLLFSRKFRKINQQGKEDNKN